MIPVRVKRVDSFFDFVSSRLAFSAVNPKNVQKKRAAFLKNGKNPQFTYEKVPLQLEQLKDMLLEIRLEKDPLQVLLERKRKELIQKIDVLQAIGSDGFAVASKKVYSLPDRSLVDKAYRLLELPASPSSKRVLRKDGIRMIRRMVSKMDLKYSIRSSEMITSARVDSMHRLLELRKRERFSEDYFKRLVVHEIGTHALRTENGLLQPLQVFKNGFPGYITTEEGLAAYNEFRAGVMSNSILRNYAGRVVAVQAATTDDFAATFGELKRFFSEKTAFKLALRAKRGLADTGDAGAYTKDVAYLRGFFDVARFSQKRDVNELYIGKVGVQDLSLLAKADIRLKSPKYTLNSLLDQGSILPSERRVDERKVFDLL